MTIMPPRANRPSNHSLAVFALLLVGVLAFLAWGATQASKSNLQATSAQDPLPGNRTDEVVLDASEMHSESGSAQQARAVAVETPAAPATIVVKDTGRIIGIVKSNDERVRRVNSGRAALQRDETDKPGGAFYQRLDGFEADYSSPIDASGAFGFDSLPLGPWFVRIESDHFETRTERVQLLDSKDPLKLEFSLVPNSMARLMLVLNGPKGSPLLDSVQGPDLETAEALQPVFLEGCPQIGSELTSTARRLIQKSRDVRRERPDLWMITEFNEPTAGCACVVLGGRVLDAVQFTQGQTLVVLRVDPADFAPQRCALDVVVRDSLTTLPVSKCAVKLTRHNGQSTTIDTNAGGGVHFESLVAGNVRVTMTRQGYAARSEEFVLAAGDRTHIETIDLEPILTISGRVRFPASGPVKHVVMATRIESGSPAGTKSQGGVFGSKPDFEIHGLAPGEYLVGSSTPYLMAPSVDDVRLGKVEGWKIVDVRHGAVHGIELEITEAVSAELQRSAKEFR